MFSLQIQKRPGNFIFLGAYEDLLAVCFHILFNSTSFHLYVKIYDVVGSDVRITIF